MGRNYIPRNSVDFNNWFRNLNYYVTLKTAGNSHEWPHIMKSDIAELDQRYTEWYIAYAVAMKPFTHGDVAARNNARNAAERVIRPFVQRYLFQPPVTDTDRANMGIPNSI